MVTKMIKDDLQNESKISEYRAIPFWSWNDELEENELREQIRRMKKQGFGGYFMHARGGLTTEYLGEKWFDCVNACIDEGKKQGMQSWAYDENGWPSGFVGGKLLEKLDNRDRYLTFSIGKYDEDAFVSYSLSSDELKRVTDEKSCVNESDKTKKVEYLNIYEHISTSTADVLNPEVVDEFIKETHEKYKQKTGKDFGKNLKGFFTDEPQYYRAAHPYTRILPDYFKDKYGEDILDRLGLLFVEKKGYRDFRYKYWKAMNDMFIKNYAEKVYEWCDKNGVQLTGHYVQEEDLKWQMLCCGGIMPAYMYEHIPGIDHLGREIGTPIPPKQVSSVAAQVGRKKVLTETFACCGWDVTPKELKKIAEWQYVNGINLMCQHLLPYSEHGQRKRDYPAHFSEVNPWVRHDFKTFNDYFARLGYLIGESEELVNVGYFSPVRSMYFDYKRNDFDADYPIDDSYLKNAELLSSMNIQYHILDETVMAKLGRVEGKSLIVGKQKYDYIVFPKTLTMDAYTAELFNDYYKNGGKILFLDDIPQYIEGFKHTYSLKSNVTLDEIARVQDLKISDYNTEIQTTFRKYGERKFVYAVNLSNDKSYTVTFDCASESFEKIDLETLDVSVVSKTITLKPCESAVLFLSDKHPESNVEKNVVKLSAPYEVVNSSDNYLLLDNVRFSTDGINYSDKIRYMGVFNELLAKRYNGIVYLKYQFELQDIPEKIYFVSEDMHNISCSANGKEIIFNGISDFDKKTYKADISDKLVKGANEIILKINFYESDHVYYVLFGENVTESLKNCLVYDSTIEACYLQGDFGVYSKNGFKNGKTAGVYLSDDDFYIGKRKTQITDTVKNGYPFFAGEITLRKNFFHDGSPAQLDLTGRFATSYLKINGKEINKSYFNDTVDISNFVKAGENVAEITLYSGNRNLLGPHHYKFEEEPLGVGPGTYENLGSWHNGVSNNERNSYSFVKFGLFDEDAE